MVFLLRDVSKVPKRFLYLTSSFIAAIELSSGDNNEAYKCNDGDWTSCATEYDGSSNQHHPWILLIFKRPVHVSSVVVILPETSTPLSTFTVRITNRRPLAGNESTEFKGFKQILSNFIFFQSKGGLFCGEFSGSPASKEYIKLDCDPAMKVWEVRYVLLQSTTAIELAEFWAVTDKCRSKYSNTWCTFPYMESASGNIKLKNEDGKCPVTVADDGTAIDVEDYDEDKCPTHAVLG